MRVEFVNLFRLSRREYYADFFITPVITGVYAYFSLSRGFGVAWLANFAAGYALWTLYEYALHRWVLHSRRGILSEVHRLHHRNQLDYVAVPPLGTMLSYAFFYLVFGAASSALMVGFSIGYIAYSTVHTMLHYSDIGPRSWLRPLLRHHEGHHRLGSYNMGISCTVWDYVFRTKYRT